MISSLTTLEVPLPDALAPVERGKPSRQRRHVLPGFSITLGFSLVYLVSLILLPLAALAVRAVTPTADYPTVPLVLRHVLDVVTDARALSAYRLSFGLSFFAALINGVFGFMVAWVLVRYEFFGKRLIDALVDLPFAMPTSVAGLALTQLFALHGGYIGQWLHEALGWRIVYTPWGITVALIFVGFPFVVRTLQPVLAGLVADVEEAAACLGANRWQTFYRVILPALRPALLTGIMLAFGRGAGEYGSIVFISGGFMPFLTEITPNLIIVKLEEFDYPGAAGLGLVMLILSFTLVALANVLQHFSNRRGKTA